MASFAGLVSLRDVPWGVDGPCPRAAVPSQPGAARQAAMPGGKGVARVPARRPSQAPASGEGQGDACMRVSAKPARPTARSSLTRRGSGLCLSPGPETSPVCWRQTRLC